MTFTDDASMNFGKFYGFFSKYWHLCEQREILYSTFKVFIKTEVIYMFLEAGWNKNKWDIRKLKWICSAINNINQMLDPKNFINDPAAYVLHAKNYFYLENTNFL